MLAKLAGYAGRAVMDSLPDVVTKVDSLLIQANRILVEVENQSDFVLTLYDEYHSGGRYESAPDGKVYPNTASVYSSESIDSAFFNSANGCLVYAIGRGDKYVAIYYSCSSTGVYKVNAAVLPALLPHSADIWFSILEKNYTKSTASKQNCGLNISYSAGEQATFTLTHL